MVKFVNTIKHPQIFVYKGYKLLYTTEENDLMVVGSEFLTIWCSKFKLALRELEKSLKETGSFFT